MGLFDKKYCDICGEKIGLLGNRKLENGNLCKNCARLLSPWFDDRRHSTVEQIKEQLAYRENNKEVLKAFSPNKTFGTSSSLKIHVDEEKGQFVVARNLNDGNNHDVIYLSQIKTCYMDVVEDRDEEYREKSNGEKELIGYKYFYDYYIYFSIDSPYFDEIKIHLNGSRISANSHIEKHRCESVAREIEAYFANVNRISSMNTGLNRESINHEAGVISANNDSWVCQACGGTNKGKFCEFCGSPRN